MEHAKPCLAGLMDKENEKHRWPLQACSEPIAIFTTNIHTAKRYDPRTK
jgi:hypothetical protein